MSHQHCTITVSIHKDTPEDRTIIASALHQRFEGARIEFTITPNQFAHVDDFSCDGDRFPGATDSTSNTPPSLMAAKVSFNTAEEILKALSIRKEISTP